MEQRVFIGHGCQMNDADFELMFGLLRKDGPPLSHSRRKGGCGASQCGRAVREKAEEAHHWAFPVVQGAQTQKPDLVFQIGWLHVKNA